MNFTVIWTVAAQNQLAALWMAAADRSGVTAASDRIDQQIRLNPLGAGESRDRLTRRILFDPPLCVLYVVDEPNRMIHVTSVGPNRRPR
jgi:hypothetical protein